NHRAVNRVTQLADLFAELLTDAALRQRLAEQARSDAKRFDYGAVAAQFLTDFERLQHEPRVR
ncbi:MAG: hypothetical protein JWM35_1903, partial [Verrucomicrobia bacterium]|nr:hypothetical protein [Verrucomicrobiota bacterium]